ncbi:MBL fold metallo-hydrolase [Vibrio methylphosphonaticus]|uniref:MBL fold metallo-hydrolase n=1 Tax=Vibrio methylphosphonaticus TaxID=2946866 RepID=UPI00202A30FA|nr:MBL fold metallo-hydrolase [Vibrio methylphosphonaticus]MCL9774921.1 MBL fold metallo-hydrolase [Vibrio methylphosphonaticus]
MKIHNIKGYIQQIYLVEYPDKLLLLDGASRADVSTICQFITQELTRPLNDLKVVVVTHMHPDHAGAAHRLRALCGCDIVSSKQSHQWYRGVDGFFMHLADLSLAWWMASRMGKPRKNLWYKKSLSPQYSVVDGDRLPNFSDWQVIATPGHTDRDISIYHAGQAVIYVADLMVQVKQNLVAPFPVFHPNQYRASIKKVYQLNAKQVLLAHRSAVIFDEKAMEHLLDTAPRTPVTHWRVVKIKAKKLFNGLSNRFSWS